MRKSPEAAHDPASRAARQRLRDLQATVLGWHAGDRRTLPWRDRSDPYAVLVSEVMLQQTQVSRVLGPFEAFLSRFPDVRSLAAAPTSAVVQAWRGLGYNRRAVSLQRAARVVVERHGGCVPPDLLALKALPGVGDYTARAVLAFAYNRDEAPVDTNVRRVLLRSLAGEPLGAAALQDLADGAVPAGRGGDWSAALMDLGSAHCTSRTPRCVDCPAAGQCRWRLTGGTDPATSVRRGSAAAFAGSSRYHRGKLLDALRTAPVAVDALPAAAGLADPEEAARTAGGLVDDGLAEWRGRVLTLPD